MSRPADDPSTTRTALATRLACRSARIAVVGLGYAGLPLAVEVARAGYDTVGVDLDPAKVQALRDGRSYIPDVSSAGIKELVDSARLTASTNYEELASCDAVSICVPTPLRKTKDPDLTHVLEAVRALASHIRSQTLVILESTTYPGTTEEAVLPILNAAGFRVGRDVFLCYSPERVDPGNRRYNTRNIPKIIGGVTPACLDAGVAYYSQVMQHVVPVSSTLAAEAAKLLENTFRMVNIGLVNETAVLCHRLGIDVWEVIDAAATKPFGFMPFHPGPGLGGHCVPIDPHFLSWKSKQAGYEPRLIRLASEINGTMPRHIVSRVQAALNDQRKPVRGSRIHLVGVAYKRDVADTRESPALDIAALLAQMGAVLTYSDPYVESFRTGRVTLPRLNLAEGAARSDISVILTDHSGVDYLKLQKAAPVVFDTRNALRGVDAPNLLRL